VTVAFEVNESGAVENVRVVSSDPPGVFDSAVIRAISRWRYAPATETDPSTGQPRPVRSTAQMRFDFESESDETREQCLERQSRPKICRPPSVTQGIPSGNRGNWFVWDPVVGVVANDFQADEQWQAAEGAKQMCYSRGGRDCYSIGGCSGNALGIAIPSDNSWAFYGCSQSRRIARQIAVQRCEQLTGCSCHVCDEWSCDPQFKYGLE
jgi:TonB family protein